MSEDLENLSREDLIARLKKAESEPTIHPNSLASVLMMDGKEAHGHYIKNVMHPAAKVFAFIVGVPVISIVLFFGIMSFVL